MQTNWGQLWLRRWRWSSANWRISGWIPGACSPHHNVSLSRILNPKLILITPDSFRNWNTTSSIQLELARAPHPCPKGWACFLAAGSDSFSSSVHFRSFSLYSGSYRKPQQFVSSSRHSKSITSEITFSLSSYSGFTWTHSTEERWQTWLYILRPLSLFSVPGLLNVQLVNHSSHPS